ncbi:MAG: hypothetical protein WAL50_10605, partial [Kineosporiaceae bacterium]
MRRAQTRPAVSVAELQRAWAAVQTGAFRPTAPPLAPRPAAGPRMVQDVDSHASTTGSGGAGTSPGWVPGPG